MLGGQQHTALECATCERKAVNGIMLLTMKASTLNPMDDRQSTSHKGASTTTMRTLGFYKRNYEYDFEPGTHYLREEGYVRPRTQAGGTPRGTTVETQISKNNATYRISFDQGMQQMMMPISKLPLMHSCRSD